MKKEIIDIDNSLSRLYGLFDQKPVKGALQGNKKISKGQVGKCVSHFSSKKNMALMPCESRLEYNNCLDLEFKTEVINYRTQPITFRLNGVEVYTPDTIHIDNLDNLVIREVKYSGKLKDKVLIKRLKNIRRKLNHINVKFDVLTEKTLRASPKFENRQILYRVSHFDCSNHEINKAINLFENESAKISLYNFRLQLKQNHISPLIADKLLFNGTICYDESLLLTPESFVWPRNKDDV